MDKPPTAFTAAAVAALLWNLAGLAAIAADLSLSAADIAALPPAQQALYQARPAWAVAGSCLAVLAGSLGSLLLVLRRRQALPVLWASLAGVALQDAGFVVVAQVAGSPGPVAVVLQGVVLAIAVGLVIGAHRAQGRAWLR